VFEFGRYFLVQAHGWCRGFVEDGVEDGCGSVTFERKTASGHFVEDYAEGKKIGAGVEFFAKSLFWRHVGDGAESGAGTGELIGIGGEGGHLVGETVGRSWRGNLSKTKIEDFGVTTFGNEDVCRFDVTMDDLFRVRSVQRVSNLNGDVKETV